MKILLAGLLCASLVLPISASAATDWDAIHETMSELNIELNKIVAARDDIGALERLDSAISNDELVSTLLGQIKSRASVAAQNLKDLLD